MGLLQGLLPPPVIVVETREDRLDIELFPEEERLLGRSVEKRRREFITGRWCAREALARLGFPPQPIGSGSSGEPLWPRGVVGSITHCSGYRACAVALTSDVQAIGIDAERDVPLPDGVWETIAFGPEHALPAGLQAVVFGAKEAIYKAWFALDGEKLSFQDAELSVEPWDGSFRARLLQRAGPGRPGELSGRWAAGGGVVATAIVIPVG